MIFQGNIALNLEGRQAYAVIDFDTGLLGFIEKVDSNEVEYTYLQSPVEFRKAFLEKVIPIFHDSIQTNFKICRKNPKVKEVNDLLRQL